MKTKRYSAVIWMAVISALQFAAFSSRAQTQVLINAFDTADEVNNNNGNPWANWFGTAFYQVLWDASDASNNPNSGSMQIQSFYPDSGIGGCCGPQFVAYDQNSGINPPLVGNGGPPAAALATNVEFDIRFDPSSVYDTNNAVWPEIEVGTRGTDFGQHDFGSLSGSLSITNTQTNWVHVVMPIAANAIWTNIPNIYFKFYSTTMNGFLKFYVDNITFDTATVAIEPPTMGIQKASPGVRIFSGPDQYVRSQLVSVDTNQSWVGGSYPVSYSFTISAYDNNPSLNEFHLFLLPVNSIQGGGIDQYTDYSTALNNLRLQIVSLADGTNAVVANLAWKTNILNSNPTTTELNITNPTAIGTWTLTFTSASGGTLTAPGAGPAAFTITDPSVAADFANPMCVFFGLQPNATTAIGQHADFTKFQTLHVASPGVPINSDFTTGIIDTNVWSMAATAVASELVPGGANSAWWVSWSYPDYGAQLATKPDLTSAVPWKTPFYYTGYDSNNIIPQVKVGAETWALLPTQAQPTVSGVSNTPASTKAFYRVQLPAPTE